MFCTTCGAANPDDGRFCQKCRAVLPVLGAPATTPPPPRSMAVPVKGIAAAATFAGRYQVLSILGKGGMGVVYRARDLELGEEIAIKVLQAQFANDPNEVARFKREILTARKITHPNVIRIHDFGVADGEAFISMEALGGGTLAERIARGLTIEEGVRIAVGLAEGLAAAHAKDVVHRDIKPHNVLFDDAGIPKLVDFGIARLATATSRTVGYAGTPHYMSPEQARGAEATALSDVYALGIVLFEIFTGRLPFQSDSLVGLAMQHANDPPPPPRTLRPDLPEHLEWVILRALAKDPAARWQRAADLATALRAKPSTVSAAPPSAPTPVLAPAPVSAPAPTPSPSPTLTPPSRSPSPVTPPPPSPRSSAGTFAIVLIALLVGAPIAGVLFLIGVQNSRNNQPTTLPIAFPTTPFASSAYSNPSDGTTTAGIERRPVGACSYVPPPGWRRAMDFEENVFDEAWQAPIGPPRIVAVGWDPAADLDDLAVTIRELSEEEDDLVVEGLDRRDGRITARLRSGDGTMRGVVIATARSQGGVFVAGIAPSHDAAGAQMSAESVAASLRCP